jgi:uncharacterized cupredoxin-like copper-binding protein
VFRLATGRTRRDLEVALADGGPGAALAVGTFVGGTGLVSPGQDSTADAVLHLEPGEHVLLCFVPDAEGAPHLAHGMLRPFTVTDGGDPVPTPDSDATVGLANYVFDGPDVLEGDAVVEVTNTATDEAHEMVVARLDRGTSATDVADALDARRPLPATGVGGMQALLPGDTQHVQLDLRPGRYVLFCAVPSPDGTPHYRAGMVRDVTVR